MRERGRQCQAKELGLGLGTGELGTASERGGGHGQAHLPAKTFLLEWGCRGCVWAGQLVRRGQGKDGFSVTQHRVW